MLDFFDFLSNSLMMPVAAIAVCVLVVKVLGKEKISEEVKLSSKFKGEKLYNVMVSSIAPFFIGIILLTSILSFLGVISM